MPDQRGHPARHLILVVVLALGLLALGAGPVLAQPLGCGAVVTQDTTLTSDLLDCQGNGLVIGADGITVDLNGHTIRGRIISGGSPDQVGIDNLGHDDVTVRNGTVTAFARGGVHLVEADRNRVQGLTMDFFGEFAILLEGGGSGNRFAGNTITTAGDLGIGIRGTATASRDNQVSGNSVISANNAGITLRYGTIIGTVIEGNTVEEVDTRDQWGASIAVGARYTTGEGAYRRTVVRGNRMDTLFGGGVFAADTATDTLVERNRVDDSYGLPAFESDGDRTVFRANATTSNFFPGSTNFGITVDTRAEDNRIEANSMDRPGGIGIDDSGTRTVTTANVIVGQIYPSFPTTGHIAGIVVREEASDGRIQANVVRRQSPGFAEDVGAGIWVFGDRYRLLANVVSEIDARDGIRVEPQATGTLLKANITTRNGDDGIDVENPASTITANVANDNTDLGIDAVPGVTDGGGNRARGNGNPAQCVGVSCS